MTGAGSAGRRGAGVRKALRRLAEGYDALFMARWRSSLQKEAQRQQDELLALLLIDGLGVESPTAYYTLELYPRLVEDFHAWHRRMGQDRLDGAVCC